MLLDAAIALAVIVDGSKLCACSDGEISMGLRKNVKKFKDLLKGNRIKRQLFPDKLIGYDDEEAAREAILRVRDLTMISYPALLSLWAQLRHCEAFSIPGALVECGVWKGGVGGLMALANIRYGQQRRHIHLFDIFDDICEPDPAVDGERALMEVEKFAHRERSTLSGKMQPLSGIYNHLGGPGDAAQVKALVAQELGYGEGHTHVHQGWFKDTLTFADVGPVAILRLDGDWYESTKLCLETFYDSVVPRGFVVIDDYGTYDGCKKAVDEFLEKQQPVPFLNFVTRDVRYIVKP